jgi:tetratricopeptide (TPR) repeat protein
MWNYKGTSDFDIGANYGVLEYDFFTINGEEEFWSLMNFYRGLWRRYDYFFDGYDCTENNTQLSHHIQDKMKMYNANLSLSFLEEEFKENGIQIRKMVVNVQTDNGSYDTYFFYFYLFQKTDIKKIISKASSFSDENFHKAAIAYYSEAIKLIPETALLYLDRGNEYCKNEDFNKAIEDFSKAIQIDENYVVAYILRGRAYSSKGNHDDAITDFSKAIELDPNNDDAYTNRGVAYANKGCLDEAIADCSKSIEIAPKDDWGYLNRGSIFKKKGDLENARLDFLKALEISPNNHLAKKYLKELNGKK